MWYSMMSWGSALTTRSSNPRILFISWMQQSTNLLTIDSLVNRTWDQCWYFQFWCLCANVPRQQRWSWVDLGHRSGCLERYPAATNYLWTMLSKTWRTVRLISSTLILRYNVRLPIRRRIWSSFDIIVFNRCPCDQLVRLLLSLTRCRNFI